VLQAEDVLPAHVEQVELRTDGGGGAARLPLLLLLPAAMSGLTSAVSCGLALAKKAGSVGGETRADGEGAAPASGGRACAFRCRVEDDLREIMIDAT
jgi:hypothetical protein